MFQHNRAKVKVTVAVSRKLFFIVLAFSSLILRLILIQLHTNAKYEHIFDRFMFKRSVIDVKVTFFIIIF